MGQSLMANTSTCPGVSFHLLLPKCCIPSDDSVPLVSEEEDVLAFARICEAYADASVNERKESRAAALHVKANKTKDIEKS